MEAALRSEDELDKGATTERIALYPGGHLAWVAATATVIVSMFALIVFAAVMVRYVVSPPPQAPSSV